MSDLKIATRIERAGQSGGHGHRVVLAVLLIGQFMANIDAAIVNVATPAIHDDLRASGGALEFIVSGYILAYAMLLITGARLGDTHGYRRVFLIGIGIFTVTSLVCGLAPDTAVLIVARVLQGVGAALMVPQVLTGIQLNFTGSHRARAIGLYVATLSGGAVAGQILGGALISANILGTDWRPIFLINVPIGLATWALALRTLPTTDHPPATTGKLATDSLPATSGKLVTDSPPATSGKLAMDSPPATSGKLVTDRPPATSDMPYTSEMPATRGAPATSGVSVTGGAPASGGVPVTSEMSASGSTPVTSGVPHTSEVPVTGSALAAGDMSVIGEVLTASGVPTTGGGAAAGGLSPAGGGPADGVPAAGDVSAAGRGAAAGGGVERGRLDVRGVVVLSVTVLFVVVPLVFGRDAGWPLWTWVLLAAAVPGLGGFVLLERRIGRLGGYPLVNLHILRLPSLGWGLVANAAATSTYGSMLFVLALYLQGGLGKSPLYSGMVLVSWVAAFGLAGPLARRVEEGRRRSVGAAGALVLAAAYLSIGVTQASGLLLVTLLGVGGLGLGLAFSSMMTRLTSAVPNRYAPDISGLIATSAQLSIVVGVAIFGSLYLNFADHPGHAFRIVTIALAATALIAALTAQLSAHQAKTSKEAT